MKICQLSIQNINSFKEHDSENLKKFKIDFTQEPLQSSPIFLIMGATGSGKTTLLDAICLNLYNRTDRIGNRLEQVINKEASFAYTELIFSIKNKLYKTTWHLKRTAKTAKKTNTPTHSLYEIQGTEEELLSDKTKEVKELLEKKIIQLDFHQFTKTILLPQGQFQNFLLATPKDKEEILEKITNTQLYADIEQQAKEAYLTAKSHVEQNEVQHQNLLKKIESLETLEYIKDKYTQLDSQINEINKIENSIIPLRDILNELIPYLSSQLSYEKKILHYQQIKEEWSLSQKAKQYKDKIQILKEYKHKCEENQTQIKDLNVQWKEIQDKVNQLYCVLRPTIDSLTISKEQNNLNNIYREDKQKFLLLSEENKLILDKHHKIDTQHKLLKQELANIQKENQRLSSQYKQVSNEIKNKANDLLDEKKIIYQNQAKLSSYHKREKQLMYQLWKYRFQKKYYTQHICPICEHNRPHEEDIHSVDLSQKKKNQLNQLIQEKKDHDLLKEKNLRHRSNYQSQLTIYKKNFVVCQKEKKNIRLIYQEYKKKEKEYLSQNSKLSKSQEKMDNMDTLIKKYQFKINIFEENKDIWENKRSIEEKMKNEKKAYRDHKTTYDAKYTYLIEKIENNNLKDIPTTQAYIQKETKLQSQWDEYTQFQKKYDTNLTICQNLIHKISSLLIDDELLVLMKEGKLTMVDKFITLKNELIQYTLPIPLEKIEYLKNNLNTIAEYLKKIKDEKEIYFKKKGELHHQETVWNELNKESQKKEKELNKQKEEKKLHNNFYALIKGKNNGNINLSKFAQVRTLDFILQRANNYLNEFQARYTLIRSHKEDLLDLDISVLDHYYTHQERSVRTLSGGEKFILSLALALGLAELISQNNDINTLFLDEGFGSLDNISLQTVISVLEKVISKRGNKKIGLISHVEYIKNYIPVQIHIKENKHGHAYIQIDS